MASFTRVLAAYGTWPFDVYRISVYVYSCALQRFEAFQSNNCYLCLDHVAGQVQHECYLAESDSEMTY